MVLFRIYQARRHVFDQISWNISPGKEAVRGISGVEQNLDHR